MRLLEHPDLYEIRRSIFKINQGLYLLRFLAGPRQPSHLAALRVLLRKSRFAESREVLSFDIV